MSLIKNKLDYEGYNLKERAYIYVGGIVGAVAPIVGGYSLSKQINPDNLVGNLFSFGESIILNAVSRLPFYGAVLGFTIGKGFSENSKKKRLSKLENKLK